MFSTDQFTHAIHEFAKFFMRQNIRHQRRFMDESGLSPSQISTLFRLHYVGDCGVTDISDHLGVSGAAASQMVERLVQQGLLERLNDPNDRRARRLILTDDGRKLVDRSIEMRQRWMEELAGKLTPEQRESIASALTVLTRTAQELDEKPQE